MIVPCLHLTSISCSMLDMSLLLLPRTKPRRPSHTRQSNSANNIYSILRSISTSSSRSSHPVIFQLARLMADVRSLLQNERANRRIVHPYARYSDSGKLTCSLCDILIKSDNAWKGHTRTPDHARRALRAAEASAQRSSKKRKADSDDDEVFILEEIAESSHLWSARLAHTDFPV